ncbi:MAG TPA: BamA/TamA family outer membrane protein [Longimicrobiales bacterium]|nr:BamA/TamA family outer membrane protein [Longimicrobiales bacterium]
MMRRDNAQRSTLLLVATALPLWLAPDAAQGQAAPPLSAAGDKVTVVPGPQYHASGFARLFLGDGWRELWLTPVDAPVFDMGSYAGGVRWVNRGGGFQTITLHLEEEDGWREYLFRSVDKFPLQPMPPEIRTAQAGGILEDQVSTLFPAAGLIVPPIVEAVEILHVLPELYVMPDDPRLEVYQDTFAGMLGTAELKPQEGPDDEPGFAASRKVKGTANFMDDLNDSREHRLDERAFLAARLVDFMINDSDRTPDNFDWARYREEGDYRWVPVARDRDRAFMDARGWLNRFLTRRFYPKLVEFVPEYSLEGLTHTSHTLDRRLLQRLTRRDFEEVAARVRTAVDDGVIEAVIEALPQPWRDETRAPERLRRVLTARRNALRDIAIEFYEDLATDVDVFGTDEDEYVAIHRHADGRVTVEVPRSDADDVVEVERHADGRVTLTAVDIADSGAAAPFYLRTFLPSETSEIRVYLGDGDDVAVVRGASSDAIAVRVIGGDGDDVLVDSAGGGATFFYDAEGEDRFVTARGTRVSVRPWDPPTPALGLRLGVPWRPDWGGGHGWGPVIDYREGAGPVVGFGPQALAYGFRRLPHHWAADAKLLVGLGNGRLGLTGDVDYRAENSPLAYTLSLRATQLDAFRFYGYGNDTPDASSDLSLVEQDRVALEPSLVWHIGWRTREELADPLRGQDPVASGPRPLVGRLEAGPALYWSDASPRAGSPLADTAAAGRADFGRVGLRFGLELDRTERDAAPTRGWRFHAGLASYPALWSAAEAYGTTSAVGSAYLPLPVGGTHLAVRAGGALATGGFPVQDAATVGGRTTLRGYRWQRYSGDAAAHFSAELRVPVGSVPLFLRWDVGVFGLADAGRVWFEGQSPGGWHSGFGGGLWLSSLGKAFSLAYARGEDHRLYFQSGLPF